MANIGSEQPPLSTPDELREFLARQFVLVNNALAQSNKFPPIYNLPDKPQDGNLYYFGRIIGATITSIGFWGYENGAWVKL